MGDRWVVSPIICQTQRGHEDYKGRGLEEHQPDYLSSFFGAAAARQRLDPLDLFARLLIKGGVPEVDVPVQARGRVVLLFGGGWRGMRYSHGRQPPR
jgi:hypothetical protein